MEAYTKLYDRTCCRPTHTFMLKDLKSSASAQICRWRIHRKIQPVFFTDVLFVGTNLQYFRRKSLCKASILPCLVNLAIGCQWAIFHEKLFQFTTISNQIYHQLCEVYKLNRFGAAWFMGQKFWICKLVSVPKNLLALLL